MGDPIANYALSKQMRTSCGRESRGGADVVRRAQIGGRRQETEEQSRRNEENRTGEGMEREIYKARVNQSRNMLPLILACGACFWKSHYLNYHSFMGNTSIIKVLSCCVCVCGGATFKMWRIGRDSQQRQESLLFITRQSLGIKRLKRRQVIKHANISGELITWKWEYIISFRNKTHKTYMWMRAGDQTTNPGINGQHPGPLKTQNQDSEDNEHTYYMLQQLCSETKVCWNVRTQASVS